MGGWAMSLGCWFSVISAFGISSNEQTRAQGAGCGSDRLTPA